MNTRLIKLRIERGLNQKEAADKIGISQSMLSALEQGHRSGSDTVKIKIANFYGQSVESIFLLIKSHTVIIRGEINMSPLINIQVKNNNQLVSARELHKNLGLTTRFSKWVDQNFENFEKEQDFTSVTTVTVVNNGARKPIQDYLLTIDMAKELCMMSKTERGKEVRKYFIQVEKNWNSPDMIMQRALSISKQRIEALQNENAAMKPKALFADSVATSKSTVLVGELAKIIRGNGVDIGATRLFRWMREHGYLINRKGSDWNMPTQRAMDLGLFKIKETTINHSNGTTSISKTPKVTGKGKQYFINKFLKGRELVEAH